MNTTTLKKGFHEYCKSKIIRNSVAGSMYENCDSFETNVLLFNSHRRAMTIELPFKFPIYGFFISNVKVATGGFIFVGSYIHSWIAVTQYISPFMTNFDFSFMHSSRLAWMVRS